MIGFKALKFFEQETVQLIWQRTKDEGITLRNIDQRSGLKPLFNIHSFLVIKVSKTLLEQIKKAFGLSRQIFKKLDDAMSKIDQFYKCKLVRLSLAATSTLV